MQQNSTQTLSSTLRTDKKSKTRRQLKQQALRLFMKQGYSLTSIDQIAARVDISSRTFFRYFANKEDLLFDDSYDTRLTESFRGQPAQLSVVAALRNALCDAFGQMTSEERAYEERRHAVIAATPELQARSSHEFIRNIDLLAKLFAERMQKQPDDPQVQTLAGAIVGVLIAAQVKNGAADPLAQMDASLVQFEDLIKTM